jgi:hypothetical protein
VNVVDLFSLFFNGQFGGMVHGSVQSWPKMILQSA